MRLLPRVVAICLAVAPVFLGGCSKADPLTDALDAAFVAELQRVPGAGVADLTGAAQAFIPAGTSLDAAVRVLGSSGFEVSRARESAVQRGMDERYVARKRSSINGRLFDYYLYEIVLEVKDDIVAEIFARAAYRAL